MITEPPIKDFVSNKEDEDFDMGSVYTEDWPHINKRGMRAFLIPSFLPLKTGE